MNVFNEELFYEKFDSFLSEKIENSKFTCNREKIISETVTPLKGIAYFMYQSNFIDRKIYNRCIELYNKKIGDESEDIYNDDVFDM